MTTIFLNTQPLPNALPGALRLMPSPDRSTYSAEKLPQWRTERERRLRWHWWRRWCHESGVKGSSALSQLQHVLFCLQRLHHPLLVVSPLPASPALCLQWCLVEEQQSRHTNSGSRRKSFTPLFYFISRSVSSKRWSRRRVAALTRVRPGGVTWSLCVFVTVVDVSTTDTFVLM